MLIRWIGTEVRIFAYFQNLALIACFLGFGLGCYWSRRKKSPLLSLASITCLVVLVKAPVGRWQQFLKLQSSLLALSPDAAIWTEINENLRISSVLPAFIAAVVVMACFLVLLVAAMIPLGQIVGGCLESASNAIEGYSVNLLGSVLGLWMLAALSFVWLPPLCWFTLAFSLVVLIKPSGKSLFAGMILLALTLIFLRNQDADNEQTYWSPYQKLQLEHLGDRT